MALSSLVEPEVERTPGQTESDSLGMSKGAWVSIKGLPSVFDRRPNFYYEENFDVK